MAYHFLSPQGLLPDHLREALNDPFLQELLALADQLDVSALVVGFREDGSGGHPYDPYLMLVSTLWCYKNGIRQPGRMAEECRSRTQLLALWGAGRTPTASTFRRFVTRHKKAWQGVEAGVLRVCAQAGLVDPGVTATDSSPMDSPASLRANRSLPRIRLRISQTLLELDELALRTEQAFQELDPRGDLDSLLDQVCGTLVKEEQRLRRRLRRLQQAESIAQKRVEQSANGPPSTHRWASRVAQREHELQTMIAHQRQRIAEYSDRRASGNTRHGPPPCAPEHHGHVKKKQRQLDQARTRLAAARAHPSHRGRTPRANLTEPTSWLLIGKNTTTWVQGHLAMITVGGGQIILSAGTHPSGNDQGGLHPSLKTAADNCRSAGITTPMRAHLADAGFASTTTFTTPAPTGGTLYVAVTNETNQTSEEPNNPPNPPQGHQEMADRLATTQGRALYKRRSQLVEPVFSQLFTRGGRHLHTRGPAAEIELTIMACTHNSLKYIRHRTRTHPDGKAKTSRPNERTQTGIDKP